MQLALEGAPLKHLHEPRAGKCRIQNRAIAQASGEILVFLDDDLAVAPGYLAAVEDFFDTHREFAAMKGRILAAEDPEKKVGPMAVYLDLPIADHGEEVIEVRGVLGANMAFRADALKQVGPFDERLGPGAGGHEEETEMSQRLRRAGFRIGYAPKALVYHEVDAARANRERFIRIARERGRCRMIHEKHSAADVILKNAIALGAAANRAIDAAPACRESRARSAGSRSRAACSTVSAASYRTLPAPYPHRFDQRVQFLRVARPGELLGGRAGFAAETRGRVEQRAEAERNFADVVGMLDSKPAHRRRASARHARERAGHHGQSAGHRFHHDVAERLEHRRHRERVRRVEERLDVRLRAGEYYARADVQLARAPREFVGLRDRRRPPAETRRPRPAATLR